MLAGEEQDDGPLGVAEAADEAIDDNWLLLLTLRQESSLGWCPDDSVIVVKLFQLGRISDKTQRFYTIGDHFQGNTKEIAASSETDNTTGHFDALPEILALELVENFIFGRRGHHREGLVDRRLLRVAVVSE